MFVGESLYYWLVEYFLDHFEKNPIEVYRGADGEIQFSETGDSLIDKWEELIAEGEDPDLTEAFSKEAWAAIQNRLSAKKGHVTAQTIGEVQKRIEKENRELQADPNSRRYMKKKTF